MKLNKIVPVATICAGVLLAGCAANEAPIQNSQCNPEAAQSLIGMIAPSDTEILTKSEASKIRRVKDGMPVTMDYLADRITVVTGKNSEKIIRATCG